MSFEVVDRGEIGFDLRDRETGTIWSIDGAAREGPLAGLRLQPIATYTAMWFAWASFHPDTGIFES